MSRARSIAFLLAVCATAHLHATPAVFDNPPLAIANGELRGLRTGDFDNDTKLDFVTLTRPGAAAPSLCVYRGNGDATFATPVCTALAWTVPVRLAVARLDGDAILDAAVVRENGSQYEVQVYRGIGDGTFAALGSPLALAYCPGVGLGDIDNDGRNDLVRCDGSILLNLGGGTFGSKIATGKIFGEPFLLDANGDGRLDVFSGSALFYGDAGHTFQTSVGTFGSTPSTMADFNGDGRADWADASSALHLGLATASGAFGGFTSYGFSMAEAVTAADLNGDGRPDIVSSGHHQVAVWLTGAGGVPGPRVLYSTVSRGAYVATGDFDGDGSVDVLSGGGNDGGTTRESVALLRGSATGALQTARAYSVWNQHPTQGYRYGMRPTATALSDVTSDGVADLVVFGTGDMGPQGITVLPGLGGGAFDDGAAQTTLVPTVWIAGTGYPVFADFSGDGAVDLVMTSSQYESYCYVANGYGTFRQTARINGGWGTAGDFNGDGHVDYAMVFAGVDLHAGNGDGTFDPPVNSSLAEVYTPAGHVAGDVNNDGRDDLVFTDEVMLGQSDSTFTLLENAISAAWPSGSIAPRLLADLDGDGNLDLLLEDADSWGEPGAELYVVMGRGDGTFGAARMIRIAERLMDPVGSGAGAGDFDGDGDLDVLLRTTVLLGDGHGSFDGYARFHDSVPGPCLVADTDANGTPDVIWAGADTNAVVVARTALAEAGTVPLSLAIEIPATTQGGEVFAVTVRATGQNALAATGAVLVSIDGVLAGITELVDGAGTVRVASTAAGTQTIAARFAGDDVYAAAEAEQTIEVTRAATQVLSYAPGNATSRTNIHIVGTVTSALPDVTGTVTVYIDDVARGTDDAVNFDVVVGQLTAGSHTLRIEYAGDASHLPSTRGPTAFTVAKPFITMSVVVNPPGGAPAGTPVTITVTFPNDPQLSGPMSLRAAYDVILPMTISGGVATLTTTYLQLGTAFILEYPGDATYAATSRAVYYTVTDAPVTPGPTSLYLITPCRLYDTRDGSPVSAAVSREINVVRRCGIPTGAKAVAVNVTIPSPQSSGYFTLYPAASPLPSTSTLNYRANKTRANNAVLTLSGAGLLKIYNSGPAATNLIIDVTGYFQ